MKTLTEGLQLRNLNDLESLDEGPSEVDMWYRVSHCRKITGIPPNIKANIVIM